ncbi:hypothetical protein Athai_57960 [Actinocatenispora thailandica]|uniref:Abortive infection protein n=1 Tax=Actinocatenispora thailandica TaxID=227318 RepID=A0A7R7DUX1_9ACTN|nr:hypothetical protein [Actinocatenispora thailandica]BCJ38293.1 hypothetical protein Athai_57960 [Actinocatenispora thailandica]
MHGRGINYDTGFLPGLASRPGFDPDTVRRDMGTIAADLHCDTVRISGGDLDRLDVAAGAAAKRGLRIWYCPFPVDLPPAGMTELFVNGAVRAERLRRRGADVVYLTGCELSLFGAGFLPGDTYRDRLAAIATADLDWWLSLGPVAERVNEFLAATVARVRAVFGGAVSYASGAWETVDWTPYDLVGVDAYRTAHNAASYRELLLEQFGYGKPVAVTEFGTCPYRGAADRGGNAWQPPDGAVRDEQEQVRYLTELLDVFEAVGVHTALWFTFADFLRTGDADLGSYGVVGVGADGARTRRAVFTAMAARYQR